MYPGASFGVDRYRLRVPGVLPRKNKVVGRTAPGAVVQDRSGYARVAGSPLIWSTRPSSDVPAVTVSERCVPAYVYWKTASLAVREAVLLDVPECVSCSTFASWAIEIVCVPVAAVPVAAAVTLVVSLDAADRTVNSGRHVHPVHARPERQELGVQVLVGG